MQEYRVICRAPGVAGLWIRTVNAEYEAQAVDNGSKLCASETGKPWADIEVIEAREVCPLREARPAGPLVRHRF